MADLAVGWVSASRCCGSSQTVVTAQRLRHEMDKVFDSALEETAERILPLAALDILGREDGDRPQRIATLRKHDEYYTYVVRVTEQRLAPEFRPVKPRMTPS
jgi:hypothetical protein